MTSDVDKNLDGNLPINAETALTVDDGVDDDVSADTLPDQHVDTSSSEDGADLHGSCPDEANESVANAEESMPSAVLQTNGEFVCSSCGETTRCARTIKRHISTHMTSQLLEPSLKSPSLKAADKNENVNKDSVMPKCPRSQDVVYKRFPRPVRKMESTKHWRSYVCRVCDSLFTSSALLNLHRVQMHRPHTCQKCSTVLIGRRNFSQHVRNEHPGLHIYKVPVPISVTGIRDKYCLLPPPRKEVMFLLRSVCLSIG